MSATLLKPFKFCLVVFFAVVFHVGLFAQHGFQKVYNHHELDTISIISDVYLLNDSIYFSGGGRDGNSIGLRFAHVNEDSGEIESLMRYDIPDHAQKAVYSNVDLDTNFRGNVVNLFHSYDLDYQPDGFRIIEHTTQGDIIFDSLYPRRNEDSLFIFDQTYLVHELEDSAYILLMNYTDNSVNETGGDISGTLIIKTRYDGEILWQQKIEIESPNNLISTGGNNIRKRPGGGYNLHYREVSNGSENLGTKWCKQHFVVLDDTGNVVSDKVFQDGTYCYTFSEAFFDGDTIYLQYFDSRIENAGQNNAYFQAKPVLAKIAPNMQIIWRKELQDYWGEAVSLGGSMKRIRKVNDTTFVGVRRHTNRISGSPSDLPLISTKKVRIYKFTNHGDYIWLRDYYYYPIDSIRDPLYELNDIEITQDGGFVIGGESRNIDSLNQGKPSQFAYLLRTNCLGFLSPPEAQFSYESEKNEVLFVNNSMNAGRYTWYFGDGDSLQTGENLDSIYHTYEYSGEYEVTLIAHGCNGEADTVKLTINVEQGAYGNIGEDFFSIYPSPLQTGDIITVESGNIENAELHFYDAQGRKVKTYFIPKAKSIYFIEQSFAAGVYSVLLIKDEAVVQDEKVVVK